MIQKAWKKNIAILLVVAMMLTIMPVAVFAEGGGIGSSSFGASLSATEDTETQYLFHVRADITTGSELISTPSLLQIKWVIDGDDSAEFTATGIQHDVEHGAFSAEKDITVSKAETSVKAVFDYDGTQFSTEPITLNADINVAQIVRTGEEYKTLDEAVAAAADGDTIKLLADCETEGLNLSKNLTIDGEEKYTITFTEYGIALWGTALTFRDCTVTMNAIGSTPYTAEWNWMTICASKNASLTLDNVTMTMDGDPEGTGTNMNKHAIYFCSNNKLNLRNGTVLTIQNYTQDALEWDGGDGGYNVNITDSTFISDHNRSGFTGTFYATIDNSTVKVLNSLGNGSNGTYYTIKNGSEVLFDGNRNWGISAWRIDMTSGSKLSAKNNGYSGIWTRVLNVDKTCTLDVEENGKNASGFSTNAGIFFQGNGTYKSNIEAGAEVTIKNNAGSGIYTKQTVCDMTIGSAEITNNGTGVINIQGQKGATYGGGIYNIGKMTLGSDVILYNNHADTAGDDIYNAEGATITFGAVGDDWYLDGDEDNLDCNGVSHHIDGWYEDGANENGTRWFADTVKKEEQYIIKQDAGTLTGLHALKAAHGLVKLDGYIFGDEDKDDIYDNADKLINGEVKLFAKNALDTPIAVTTSSAGYFEFKDLPYGDYVVQITLDEESSKLYNAICGISDAEKGNQLNQESKIEVELQSNETVYAGFKDVTTSGGGGGGSTTYTDRTVTKLWKNDDAANRPSSITINVLNNGEVSSQITLSEANDWTYSWKTSSGNWDVEEVNVPAGYTSSVSQSGNDFTITNTYTGIVPEEPITDPEVPTTEPTIPEEPITDPDVPTTDVPGTPVEPIAEPEVPLGDAPKTGDSSNAVPYAALALAAGAGLVIARRKFN